MKKISTRQLMSQTMTAPEKESCGPKAQTIAFLKQFARVYSPAPVGSIILN